MANMCILCGYIESYIGEFDEYDGNCPICNADDAFVTEVDEENYDEDEE